MANPVNLPPRASYTQIACYQRCNYKFWLKYVKGVKVRGKGMGLLKGTLLHEAYDKYLFNGRQTHEDAYLTLERVAAQEISKNGVDPTQADQAVTEATAVLRQFLPWADENDKFQVVIPEGQGQCETSGNLPIKLRDGTYKDLFFKIDVLIAQNGELGMMENKFRKDLDSSGLEHDLQILIYQASWNVLNKDPAHKIGYILYNIVGNKPPKSGKNAGQIAVRQMFYRGEAEQRRGLSNVATVLTDMKVRAEAELQMWPLSPKKECSWDCEYVGMCLGIRAGASLEEYTSSGAYVAQDQAQDDSEKVKGSDITLIE